MHNNVPKAVNSLAHPDTFAKSLAVIALLSIGATHRQAVAQPQMVRWEILATVIEIDDPLGLFPDVRLGDPVRGMLKYDLTLFPNPLASTTHIHYFTNEIWVDVARMVIENPRDGTEFEFQTDVEGDLADVIVFNDYAFQGSPTDGVFAQQSVIPPDGYLGESPAVFVNLDGPTSNFPQPPQFPTINDRPPSQLNLDDWPLAALVFTDAYQEDPTATGIAAEIYSLTPVVGPPLPGDYDYDGDVDHDDFYGWRATFGDEILLYADGNGDGTVDAADYVVWRKYLGQSSADGSSSNTTVPEPSTIFLLLIAAGGWCLRRRPATF